MTSVRIGNSVTEIGACAFKGCSKLTDITIGKSVSNIRVSAFEDCIALTTLYLLNTTPPTVYSEDFSNNQYMTLNVYVPQEALEAYQNANVWKDFWHLQGFDATGIENVKTEKEKNRYYDLHGNRFMAPKHGLNVINGNKVIVK